MKVLLQSHNLGCVHCRFLFLFLYILRRLSCYGIEEFSMFIVFLFILFA